MPRYYLLRCSAQKSPLIFKHFKFVYLIVFEVVNVHIVIDKRHRRVVIEAETVE